MKNKKLWSAAAALLLALCLLAGCAGSPSKDAPADAWTEAAAPAWGMDYSAVTEEGYAMDMDVPMDMESPAEPEPKMADNGAKAADALASRKIIRDANLSVQTLEFDAFLADVNARILALGGYVSASYTNNNTYYSDYMRSASITARIPAEQLDAFLTGIGTLGNVTDQNIYTRDVTTRYVDTEAHLKALRTEQDSLMGLLERAETVEDLITVQGRLSEVRYEIESYESILRTYDDQIAFSTVEMSVSEVRRKTATAEETFGEEIRRRFAESLEDVGEGFREFGVWFIGNLPQLLTWAIVLGVIVLLIVRFVKKSPVRRAKRQEKKRQKIAKRYAEEQAKLAAKQGEDKKEN